MISEIIKKSAEANIPVAKKESNRISELPEFIVTLIKTKNYWWRKFVKSKSQKSKENLNELKATIKMEIQAFKNNQWINFMERLGKSPQSTVPFWKSIGRLRNKKSSKNKQTLVKDGVELNSDKEKAEAFAERLGFIFSENEDVKFDKKHKEKIDKFIKSKKYETIFNENQKMVKHFTKKELEKAIKNLNNKGSPDQCRISNKILKNLSSQTKEHIRILFNQCLDELTLPAKWKTSVITMLPKKSDDKSNLVNYRPISITPCLMRLLERPMLARLKQHLKDNDILIKNQSGFREYRQTKDNLVFLTQKIQESINKEKGRKRTRKVLAVFFDIQAAFDKVWHNGLLYKLIEIKTPYYLIKIIENFLQERTFTVKIGCTESKPRKIECGTLQGACLSPTLFSIFVNDVPTKFVKNKEYSLLFADDLVYFHIYNRKNKTTIDKVNKYVAKLELWANKWRLCFAPKKCEYIIFTREKKKRERFEIKLYNTEINETLKPKFLGIRFYKYGSFKHQVQYIREKCMDRLNIIKTLVNKKWGLSPISLIQIYTSLVQSLIEYSSFIFNALNKTHQKSIQVIQNAAMRIIFKKKRSLVTMQLFN